jgi:hypothetical protein|tara:strand:- start:686 stop:1261 length:576 start_codon:yes stop_codon:yes gene_type:complete
MFCVKKFTIGLFSVIFTILIVSSAQSVTADNADLIGVDIIPTKDSEFQVHLQVVVRNLQGQLVSVTESTSGFTTVAHPGKMITGIVAVDNKQVMTNLTDNVFNEEVEKEIITVGDIKHEKVQWIDAKSACEGESCKDAHHNVGAWNINFFGDFNEFGVLNIPLFQALTSTVILEENDSVTNQWTVLRAMDT